LVFAGCDALALLGQVHDEFFAPKG
jgi:hypothetical protein